MESFGRAAKQTLWWYLFVCCCYRGQAWTLNLSEWSTLSKYLSNSGSSWEASVCVGVWLKLSSRKSLQLSEVRRRLVTFQLLSCCWRTSFHRQRATRCGSGRLIGWLGDRTVYRQAERQIGRVQPRGILLSSVDLVFVYHLQVGSGHRCCFDYSSHIKTYWSFFFRSFTSTFNLLMKQTRTGTRIQTTEELLPH